MYKIIGADQKEYGPVTGDQVRQWLKEGRANAQTRARAEGAEEWKSLADFPEFADVFGTAAAAAPPLSGAVPAAEPLESILVRDYDLEIGRCIGNGWNLLKNNFGLLFAGFLIYLGIEFAIGLLGAIPFVGPLFSLANLFVVGPLLGGIYYVNLQAIRRQPVGAGDVFVGFRRNYLHLFLGNLVPGLIAGLCLIPAGIVALLTMLPSAVNHRPLTGVHVLIIIAAVVVCVIPMIFLQINWLFTLPLVVDRGMGFWTAMQTSWRLVIKHWWRVFGLALLVILINMGGLLLCCVGLLFTGPITFAALMYGYESIFGSGRPPAA